MESSHPPIPIDQQSLVALNYLLPKIFEPGTVVNFESQLFSPRMSGITYYIDTLMFIANTAYQPLKSPLELVVMGE
jgi:hypothetical protein